MRYMLLIYGDEKQTRTMSDADRTKIFAEYRDFTSGIQASGGHVDSWIVDGAEHVQAVSIHSAEYEQRMTAFFSQNLQGS